MILMHKNIEVAKISNTSFWTVESIMSPEHMPLGTKSFLHNMQMTGKLLESWNKARSIPRDRQNLNKIIEKLGCSLEQAKEKAKFVSLTDCYWLKEENDNITWQDVNYHDNGFSDCISKATLLNSIFNYEYNSPDFFTDGMLSKGWMNIDNIPTLIKTGVLGENCNGKHLLCANEVAASKIGKKLGFNVVNYIPILLKNEMVCSCECFVHNSNEEAISLMQIEKELGFFDAASVFEFSTKHNCKQALDELIILNVLINNIDCHEKNISFFRNPNTLEITGMAPIYDMGSSFGFNNTENIASNEYLKPFKIKRNELLSFTNILPDLPDKQILQNILQNTYEQFEIEEKMFDIAKTELQAGIECIQKEILAKDNKIFVTTQHKNIDEQEMEL